jgi:hypothetical protein
MINRAMNDLEPSGSPSRSKLSRLFRCYWSSEQIGLLSAAIAFLVVFAFSFDSTMPQMATFVNLLLSVISAFIAWLSRDFPRSALAGISLLCCASPIFSPSYAALELVAVFVLFQVTLRSDLPPTPVAGIGFTALTANDFWLRYLTDATWSGPTVLYPAILTALVLGLGMQGRRIRAEHSVT